MISPDIHEILHARVETNTHYRVQGNKQFRIVDHTAELHTIKLHTGDTEGLGLGIGVGLWRTKTNPNLAYQ